MKKIIDFRSDTVTLPTEKMLDAIKNAKLGDDVFQEDPTINELENKAAKIMGKEAALLVPSGTMGNLISILVHCPRGSEIILGDQAHTFIYEAGGISAFGGIHSRQLKNKNDGTLDLEEIKSAIRKDNVHFPKTSAITLENTHNLCNGSPISAEYCNLVADIAHSNNMNLHIDGARIFNASVALDKSVQDLVENVDSLTFCLSKGLSSPIGSIICGEEYFIYEARRMRKALGGGMRQAGIVAAAGIVALDTMVDQIKKDHLNARFLAEGISNIEGLSIDLNSIKTNILYFDINKERFRSDILSKQTLDNTIYPFEIKLDNIHFFESYKNRFRIVTHYGIDESDVEKLLSVLKTIIK
tara:strand:- start:318 stop:1385 length:1068 start_codon:yes stop_codon:yes gene_type:complete